MLAGVPSSGRAASARTTCSNDAIAPATSGIAFLGAGVRATRWPASPGGTRAARAWIGSDRTPGLVAAHASRDAAEASSATMSCADFK